MQTTIINRGDVFYANLECHNTSVQSGVRPIVIVSNQKCNRYSPIVSIVCLTTSTNKSPLPTHVSLSVSETGLSRDSICLCEQPMSISKTALLNFITTLDDKHMRKIEIALRCQLGL